MATLQNIIDQAWEDRASLSPSAAPKEVREAVATVLAGLNDGSIRVAERQSLCIWNVNLWVKKAVLISFRLEDNQVMSANGTNGFPQFYDKVPTNLHNIAIPYPELEDDLMDMAYDTFSNNGHKLGGYAYFTQEDPRKYQDEFKDFILLFQLDSDDHIMWGDVGVANFFIHPDDLGKKDFSKVMYNWDCS